MSIQNNDFLLLLLPHDEYERDKRKMKKNKKELNLFNERFKASMRSKRLMIIKNKTLNTRTRQKESTKEEEEIITRRRRRSEIRERPTLADRQLQ